MATGGADCSIKLIDVLTKTIIATYTRSLGITRPVCGIAISPNN